VKGRLVCSEADCGIAGPGRKQAIHSQAASRGTGGSWSTRRTSSLHCPHAAPCDSATIRLQEMSRLPTPRAAVAAR
jgi:hypothetical protein